MSCSRLLVILISFGFVALSLSVNVFSRKEIDEIHRNHGVKQKTTKAIDAVREDIFVRAIRNSVCFSENIEVFVQQMSHKLTCCRNKNDKKIKCSKWSQYRTIDGRCNNLKNPLWGAAETPYRRFADSKPAYDDGVNSPRGFDRAVPLPTPRQISAKMTESVISQSISVNTSLLLVQWGQFVNHDLVRTPQFATLGANDVVERLECCEDGITFIPDAKRECIPLDVTGDPYFNSVNLTCRRFVRSLPTEASCNLGYREQINLLTHFLDCSNVYGSSIEEMKALRSFKSGTLNHDDDGDDGKCDNTGTPYCFLPSFTNSNRYAGDIRVLEQPGITSMHAVFMRFHNKVASVIRTKYLFMSDNTIFEETRRIVSAVFQSITYSEYLPILLGPDGMNKYNLHLKGLHEHSKDYDDSVNPVTSNVFAAAAYRFGHTLVTDEILAGDNILKLAESFDNSAITSTTGSTASDIMKGMASQASEVYDHIIVKSLTNKLFAHGPSFEHGTDLYALNIQRGRDHGIPDYNFWREKCNLPTFKTFDDMVGSLRIEAITALRSIYNDVNDVDLFPAGLSEIPSPNGGILGPTFGCIIGQHAGNIKIGDRFWFEYNNQPKPFTYLQLKAIKSTKLANLLCHFTTAETIQKSVFHWPTLAGNEPISCDLINEGEDVLSTLLWLW